MKTDIQKQDKLSVASSVNMLEQVRRKIIPLRDNEVISDSAVAEPYGV